MRIKLIIIGKTDEKEVVALIKKYQDRLKHYTNFEIEVIANLKHQKNRSIQEQKKQEGKLILKNINKADLNILLDEKGKHYTSQEFSVAIQKMLNAGHKQVNFIIGGAYGFSDEVYAEANQKIAFSKMTFSHQMIRLFFVEQLYRAFTIIKNENYHHE